jgi:formylglycine-generating enzyme required for sulfatase activity
MTTRSRWPLMIAIVCTIASVAPGVAAEETELRVAGDRAIPLVRLEPGKFEMGRSSSGAFTAALLSFGDQGDWATEGPVRQVTISKPFCIGKYKITAEQFCKFLNSIGTPEQFVSINRFSNIEERNGVYQPKVGKNTYPINVVHWDGAARFCKWLSETSGRAVRLPTEAEWEYAARGSQGRRVPWEKGDVSPWSSTEGAAVDAFPDNSTPEGVIGLVDLVVGEWCSDFYGVRYLPEDTTDPKGPLKDQLPVKSDLRWLATVEGEYHVLRGRVKSSDWSTTSRDLGDRAVDGVYGFRIVVEQVK